MSVDDRIVSMTFDNENFERRVSATLDSLDKLSESLKFAGAQDGFAAISNAADSVNLGVMADQVDNISGKFTALGAVAFSVIQNITNSVIRAAESIPTNFFESVLGGGKQRALNLEQARFLFEGIGADVEESMANAKQAVLGTAFGLDEAAKAAAQLEASGTKAGDELTGTLRGIAGVAAMTNSSFAEISDVFTQAAGQGKVSGYTLERISQRGLNVASVMAKQMGKTEAEVRQMASDGKIDFQTFAKAMDEAFGQHATEANKTYTGSLANMHAAMSRLGAEFHTPSLIQQRDLFNTLTPVIDNLHDALTPLIKTIVNLKGLSITHLIAGLGNINFDTLKFSIPTIAHGITNIYEAIHQILSAGHDAFRDIFPKSSVSLIATFAVAFEKLSEKIKMGDGTVEKIKFVFDGLFTIVHVLVVVIRDMAAVFGFLFSQLAPVTSGVGDFIVHIARLVQWYGTWLILSGKIDEFFLKLADTIRHPTKLVDDIRIAFERLVSALQNLFGGGSGNNVVANGVGNFEVPLTRFQQRLEQLKELPGKIGDAWDNLKDRFQPFFDLLGDLGNAAKNFATGFISKLGEVFGPGSFDQVVDLVNVGLIGGIFLILKRFLQGGGLGDALTGNLYTRLKTILSTISTNVTVTLKEMQSQIKAQTLFKIAEAIALMAASLTVLSLIDSAALTKALAAMAVGFTELFTSMKLLDTIGGGSTAGFGKTTELAIGMNLMATAILILSGAIALLSHLDPVGLTRGLIAIGASLTIMVGAVSVMSANEAGIIGASFAMNLIAGSLIILSGAVLAFGKMDWGTLGKGLLGIAGALVIITAAMDGAQASIPGAIALGIVAFALNGLFLAVKGFSTLDWGELGKGLLGLAGVLVIVTAALEGMQGGILGAAAIFIVAPALVVLAEAVRIFAALDMGEIGKGLLGLGGSLLILNAALLGMEGALPGAAALLVVAPAIAILAKVVTDLGKLELSQILTGLGALAAVLAVLGIAAALMTPVIPALTGLGLGLALVGGAIALFGAGIFFLAKGLETLAVSGAAGVEGLTDIIKNFLAGIPKIVAGFIQALIDSFNDLLNGLPLLVKLLKELISQLLDAFIELEPKIGVLMLKLLNTMFDLIIAYEPRIVEAGLGLLLALLHGIEDNIGEITQTVVNIISNFLISLGQNADTLVNGIHSFLLDTLKAVAYMIGNSALDFIPIGIALVQGFIDGLKSAFGLIWGGISDFVGVIIDAFKSMLGISSPSTVFYNLAGDVITGFLNGLIFAAQALLLWFVQLPLMILGAIGDLVSTFIPAGINVLVGFLEGIGQKELDILDYFVGLPGKILGWIESSGLKLAQAGIDLITGFFTGITDKIKDVKNWFLGLPAMIVSWIPNPLSILSDVGSDIIDGLSGGITGSVGSLGDAVKQVVGTIPDDARAKLASRSPARVMIPIGKAVIQGLIVGIKALHPALESTSSETVDKIKEKFNFETIQSAMSKAVDQMNNLGEFNPTITPVLDLTKVQQDSAGIAKLIAGAKVSATLSIDQANIISGSVAANQQASTQETPTGPSEVTFNQTINSPKPVNANDVYKGTKSQLALAKEELGI